MPRKFILRGKEWEIDEILAQQLDKLYQDMKKDDDGLILIVGAERIGKSTFRDMLGGYWEHITKKPFNVNNIHFTSSEYMKWALKQPEYTFITHDETRRDLNSKRSMSKNAVNFTNYLSECGDNNQIHCLILPAFSDIDKYVALWRCKFLIEIGKFKNSRGKYERGLFRVIKTRNKKKLEFYHKNKYQKFPRGMVAFTGRFKDNQIIPRDEYKKKKQAFKELKYIDEEKKSEINLNKTDIEVVTQIKPSQAYKEDMIMRQRLKNLQFKLRKHKNTLGKDGFGLTV